MKEICDIMEKFADAKLNKTYLKVCAPMVRYSKVHFRTLVRNFNADLCFTPMILADSFCQNSKARANEFMTTTTDFPVIAQFAANNRDDFVDASKLVYPYVDGVDLNCGCPQKWAMKDGYGCSLLSKPEIIYDIVKGLRNVLPNKFSISVKIRLLNDIKKTVILCQQLEKCGVTFLTIHGRTIAQKSSGPVDINGLKEVREALSVPMVANGGVKNLNDANHLYEVVKCSGVMAAGGLLSNPALFSGITKTPLSCVKMWMELKNKNIERITFQCYHHHLVFMLEKVLTKQQKQIFNHLSTFESVDDFILNNLFENSIVDFHYKHELGNFTECQFPDQITMKHCTKCRTCGKSVHYCVCNKYDYSTTHGNFFISHINADDGLDYMDSNIFDEPI